MSRGSVKLVPRPTRYDRGTPIESEATVLATDTWAADRAKERRIMTVRIGIRLGVGSDAANEIMSVLGLQVTP